MSQYKKHQSIQQILSPVLDHCGIVPTMQYRFVTTTTTIIPAGE